MPIHIHAPEKMVATVPRMATMTPQANEILVMVDIRRVDLFYCNVEAVTTLR